MEAKRLSPGEEAFSILRHPDLLPHLKTSQPSRAVYPFNRRSGLALKVNAQTVTQTVTQTGYQYDPTTGRLAHVTSGPMIGPMVTRLRLGARQSSPTPHRTPRQRRHTPSKSQESQITVCAEGTSEACCGV